MGLESTGINDKFGEEIFAGDELKLVYETIVLYGSARKGEDGFWEIYQDENNRVNLEHLNRHIEKLKV